MTKVVKALVTNKCAQVGRKDRIYEAIVRIAADKETMLACVVDEDCRLVGIITPREVLKAIEVRQYGATRYPFFEGPEVLHLLTSRYAEDLMTYPVSVHVDDDVEQAINIMLNEGFYEVPVVDKENKVVGELSFFTVIANSVENLKQE